MDVKLTLKLDATAIRSAKRYARKHGTSVSALVRNYFESLTPRKKKYLAEELAGCLKDMQGLSDKKIKAMYVKDTHRS